MCGRLVILNRVCALSRTTSPSFSANNIRQCVNGKGDRCGQGEFLDSDRTRRMDRQSRTWKSFRSFSSSRIQMISPSSEMHSTVPTYPRAGGTSTITVSPGMRPAHVCRPRISASLLGSSVLERLLWRLDVLVVIAPWCSTTPSSIRRVGRRLSGFPTRAADRPEALLPVRMAGTRDLSR